MANTHTLIQTITVGSGSTTEINFASIPQTYTDLKFVVSARDATGTNIDHSFRMNGDGSSVYSWKRMMGNGSGTTTQATTGTRAYYSVVNGTSSLASAFGSSELYFPNYTNSNYKVWNSITTGEQNVTLNYTGFYAGQIALTSAITSITFYPEPSGANSFAQYTTATLYGIKNT
jgi:hypothetical protein